MQYTAAHSETEGKKFVKKKIELLLDSMNYSPNYAITLPNNFLSNNWEFKLIKKYPSLRIHCYEKDRVLYNKLWTSLMSRQHEHYGKIMLSNENVFDANFVGMYDLVWLDLCGTKSEENVKNVVGFISKIKFSTQGMFIVTVTKARHKAWMNGTVFKYIIGSLLKADKQEMYPYGNVENYIFYSFK